MAPSRLMEQKMSDQKYLLSGVFLVIIFIFLRTLTQIMFKNLALGPGGSSYIKLLFDPLFYLIGVIFLGQAAVWLMVLKRLPLSEAYPFTSVTVITLLISGALFFGETITTGNVLGSFLIMAGVMIIAGDKKKNDPFRYLVDP
jgi:drug/metabolite transporter (DMT)-like permease